MDELAIWSKALSLEEIQAHYNLVTPEPVVELHFDEGYGTMTYDETPNNNDGTLHGPTWTSEGRFGKALEFDGVDDYVEIPDDESLHLTNAITIEAWAKTDSFGLWRTIAAKDKSGVSEWWFGYNNLNRLQFKFNGQEGYNILANTVITDTDWHYLVGVYNGSHIYVFVDGALDSPPTSYFDINQDTGSLKIGYTKKWDCCRWIGTLDEVVIHPRALSAEEIQQRYYTLDPEPISQWHLNEGSGSTAYDAYGDNDGTIVGATWTTGISGSALALDGINDYVKVPDDDTLDFGPGQDFSISAWVKAKPDQAEWQGTILAKLNPPSGSVYK
ncbi:LamG-like jellyroll fold domain-containing protein, partial [[Eubacterium] cellulosolvens]